jgi:proteasome lid subunit RPN8/RPN11
MNIRVVIRSDLLDMILEGAKQLHPRETIVLLRGKSDKDLISISEVVIPPLATYGKGFSSFHTHMLPMDFSIIGIAHSHPSGSLRPSVGDINHPFGKITIIMASPYTGRESAAAYDREGKRLTIQVT